MSTPSDPVDLDFLISIGMKRIKIGSSDIDNKPLLYKASQTGLQIILSTGMATFFEVQRSINFINSMGLELPTLNILWGAKESEGLGFLKLKSSLIVAGL